MKMNPVDDFVQQNVLPEHQAIVAMLRKLMRECAPKAKEQMSYGIPAWKNQRILAVISPTKKDITFAFSRGADFQDKYGLLQGVGKVSKHVKLKALKDINKPALRYYIKQALAFDTRKQRPNQYKQHPTTMSTTMSAKRLSQS